MGNTVVAIPSEAHPLAAAGIYQVLETSDLPGGVLNFVTGLRQEIVSTLAEHDGVDAIWSAAGDISEVEVASAGNMKRVWNADTSAADEELLRAATQVKNIWLPHGV
jgi:aldehyde dehydrogenase (NAD+)